MVFAGDSISYNADSCCQYTLADMHLRNLLIHLLHNRLEYRPFKLILSHITTTTNEVKKVCTEGNLHLYEIYTANSKKVVLQKP